MSDRIGRRARGLALGLAASLGAILGLPGPGVGQFSPNAKGKARPDDLLKSAPFDRITLTDNAVFEVEPVDPRPLPPIEKKKAGDAEVAPRRGRSDAFARKDNGEGEAQVVIHMIEGEPRDFKVKRSSIKDVEYFEDMLLLEADRLIKADEFARAFERLQVVKNRDPNWPGLEERVNRLLFEEGSASLGGDNPRALVLLTDLRARKPDYPGLADPLVSSFATRIARALEVGDYLVGRRLIREVEALAPGHLEAKAAREAYQARARDLVAQAAKADSSAKVDRLGEAARVWPGLDGLEPAYRAAFRAEPTLAVAVADLADPVGPFPKSQASARVARLVYLPLLASDDEEAGRGAVEGQLLAGLELFELGKGLRIRLKPGLGWSDGSRPVTAVDVARSLADRAVPASPGFSARWADLLDRVEVTGEDRLEVRLTRATMKPETWLLGPVGPAQAAADGWVSTVDRGRRPVGDGPYRWDASNDQTTLLHAVEPATGPPASIRRVLEVRHPNQALAFEALIRGEVALMEHVSSEQLKELAGKPDRYKVGRFATPSMHRIALDGRNPVLRNRRLRRALSMAINRRGLLEDVILRRPVDETNLVADGPFVKGSFVDAQGVEPLVYDPLLAKGLVAAAKKELGGNAIRLTLEHPATPEARAACPKIAEGYALIGVELTLVERPEAELELALRSGRKFDLAYRASRPTQPLRDAGPMLLPGYDAPPSADALESAASPRILQLLIQLDRAPETTSARALAIQVDRESRDELPVLPLWQLQDHYAWRADLRGPLEVADHLYQDIAKWEVEPWFPQD